VIDGVAAPTTTAAVTAITDNVGIFQGTVASGATTDDTSLSISGTISAGLAAGETVRVYDGSEFLGNATVSDDGTIWSYADSRALSDNQSVSYTAQVADAAGNQSDAGSAYTAMLDTVAPNTPVISTITDDVALITGTVASGGSSNDTVLVIAGTAEANSSVTLYNGSTSLGTTSANSSGVWSFTTATLTNGSTYTFNATATDGAGNVSAASTNYTVTVDTAAPPAPSFALTSDSGSNNSDGVTNDGTVTVSDLETNATWEYSTDSGSSWTTGSGSSFALAAGSYAIGAIRVRQTDLAGNTTVTPSQNDAVITVDLTAPTTTVAVTAITDNVGIFTGTVASGATTDDTSLSISGTISAALAAGETVRIYDGSEFLGNATVFDDGTTWSYADTRTLTNTQSISYTAQVADAAGNQSAAGSGYTATVDK
jgi:hypothetical protein